jgi:alkylation response protein AidB-like acyl-CoA dehydrogenase
MTPRSKFAIDAVMDVSTRHDAALRTLRQEVRDFCRERLPEDIRAKVLSGREPDKEDHLRWQRILSERNWLIGHWPREHGGLGWSRLERWIFENELYRVGSPWLVPFGVTYVAPILIHFGSPDQQQRWLGPTARSEIWWAQGYSEPNAGSDLANIQTAAVLDGDSYVVTGQKIWTTMAHWADMMFTLVRTDLSASPQRGISFLLIDLRSRGVTIRPIPTIDGDHHLNEVFLDEVRVPTGNLAGEPGRGWTYAKLLLGNERLLAAEIGKSQRMMAQLEHLMKTTAGPDGRPLAANAAWIQRVTDLGSRMISLEALCYELFLRAEQGRDPGVTASVLKLIGAELIQAISLALTDAVGHVGLAAAYCRGEPSAGIVGQYLYGRAATIYGGTSEIQRNILAKAALGL